ncbi:ERF family protein [Luteimonas sp. TWI662]|uniref:ERF family protein n=1 Tax=Luteimonas sp. TWI662 TaxID=3136789 RepID=UPI0032097551
MTARAAKKAARTRAAAVTLVEKPQAASLPAAQQQAAQVVSMLERVLTAPNFDIERAERLWAMQKEIRAEQARADFVEALSAMQSNIPPVKRTGKIKNNANQVQSTYAKWEHINEAIGPVLRDHGFALSFRVQQEGNAITITCVLSHRAGHQETTQILLAPDTTGNKNAPQAVVSAISYGKRTTASALLNITSYDEDDDGQKFADPGKTDEAMAEKAEFEAAIMGARTETELRPVGEKIAGSSLPPRLRAKVRQTYTARLRQIRDGEVR